MNVGDKITDGTAEFVVRNLGGRDSVREDIGRHE